MSIKILSNLNKISIVLFTEILNENNPLLLIKDYDENTEYTDETKEICANTWVKLFDDYFLLKNDSRARESIKKHSNTGKLYSKIRAFDTAIIALNNLKIIELSGLDTVENIVKNKTKIINSMLVIEDRITINRFDDFDTIIKRLIKVNNSLLNEFNLIEKRVDQTQEKAKTNIYKSITSIQNVLGYSLGDVNKINVPMFIELEKTAINKSNAQKQKK